ncbi:ComEC/Rec2 family competence protein [Chryseobacterium echinoideorum]|uniref:ComEC/Rec2 family competence protein n=1 Tax=Chryseobacterium echinoideorum TaxID=1549648 RepID=UPI001185CC59|nr:ComEC/Rec2 family competence protein [Chryseobacterium echinoideorum]
MNKQPFLIAVFCFILGIFFQDYLFLRDKYIFFIVFIAVALAGLFFINHSTLFKIRTFIFTVFFFLAGIVLHSFNIHYSQSYQLETNELIVFKISKKLNSNQKYKKYEVLAEVDNRSFKAIVNIKKELNDLDFKHYYKAQAYIVQPQNPEHSFQFNYKKYLSRKNIFQLCYFNEEISVAARNDLNFAERSKQKRLEVLQKINASDISPKSREFLKGIILADRTEIDAETVQDFNRSGLVHLLAISGTHIAVIFGIFYFLLTRFSSVSLRKYVVLCSLVFIWIFAFFIGFGNSVVRSCIMLSIYFIYVILQRKPDLLHSLSISAFIILIVDSYQIFDVGFQLSFLAVLGIFWLNQPILKYFPRQDSFLKKLLFNTVSISLSAQLATLPLVLYYFHQFSFVSFLANVVIVPFSQVIIVFSFIMTGLIAVNLEFSLLDILYDSLIRILLKVIHWFAEFDMVFFENISFNLAEVFAFYLCVYYGRFFLNKTSLKNLYHLVFSIFIFLFVRISYDIYGDFQNEIHTFTYKEAKVIGIRNGENAVFLMKNSAEEKKIRQFIIDPYLSSERINNFEIKHIRDSINKVKIGHDLYEIN